MTEALSPPVAPTKPHTWHRPTGDVDDPYAWLRDRDDPDTIAYLTAENAYSQAWFDDHAALVDELYEEIKSRIKETDESVPGAARPVVVRHADRRGPVVPGLLPGPHDRHGHRGDPRLQRRGRRPRLLRRPRRRPVAGPLAAGVVERPRRQRDLHAAGARPGHRCRAARRADGHVVVGRRGVVGRRAVALLRPPRRPDAPARDLAPPPRHAGRRRRAGGDRARRALQPRRLADAQRALDRHLHPQPDVVGGLADPGRRPDGPAAARAGAVRGRRVRASITGTTASWC